MKGKAPVFTSHLFTSHLNSMNAPTLPILNLKVGAISGMPAKLATQIKCGKVEMTLNKEVS